MSQRPVTDLIILSVEYSFRVNFSNYIADVTKTVFVTFAEDTKLGLWQTL